MLRLAFVFPGQGAQFVGMGKDLAEEFNEVRKVYDLADEVMGFPLSKICFEGPPEVLNKTEITQPAVLTTSIAIYELLRDHGINPVMAAGLSLGEYSALVSSGVLRFEDALRIVSRRGRIMQEAVPEGKGMMAAVLGLDNATIERTCQEAACKGIVNIANYNCPGQIVISGEREAVLEAIKLLKDKGAKAVPLAVSVPSHSRLMEGAAAALRKELNGINWSSPAFPVISNTEAREIQPSDLPEILVKQIYSPIKWEQSVILMADKIDFFLEVGPGKVLSGLIKKTARSKPVGNVGNIASFKRTLEKLREEEK